MEGTTHRIKNGLAKIGLVLRSHAWQEADARGLTPTQGQVLALLAVRPGRAIRLCEVADELGVTPATASHAVAALVRKRLVQKTRDPGDRRALALTLTEAGRREAGRVLTWPDFLMEAVDALSPEEQRVFLRGLVKMIRVLQESGRIPVARMCVNCRFFRPYVYDDPHQPHHCAFVDAPFGDLELRLDCPDHASLPPEEEFRVWSRFLTMAPGP